MRRLNSAPGTRRPWGSVVLAATLLVALAGCGGGGSAGGSGSGSGGGGALSAPVASTSAALIFASTAAGGTSAPQTVTLSNTGTAPLTIAAITASDAAFKIAGGTCAVGTPVAAGASCTVTVAFAPTAVGAATGTLTFSHNASPYSSAVALSGNATAVAVSNPDLVTSVTPATYAAGTIEKGGWDLLMAQRQACGFGLLQQDTRLDAASAAHAYYLVQNSLDRGVNVTGHFEDPTWSYFYGNAPWDRATHAGFPASVVEIYNALYSVQWATQQPPYPIDSGPNESLGALTMRALVETVYHARGAFWAGRSGGIGAMLATGPSAPQGGKATNMTQYRIVSELSDEADAQKQRLGTGNVATWPCGGLTSVGGKFTPAMEQPNPFPEITSTSVIYGTPIYFKADAGSTLVVSSATVTKTSDGSALTLRQLTKANDPAAEIGDNEVFLVPTTALAVASSYSVNATGTLNGVAFTKTFTFSTAP